MNNNHFMFVQLKAYGDFVVLACSLRMLSEDNLKNCSILITPHLKELASVLSPSCSVKVLNIPDHNLPAVFDIKKRGIVAAVRNAFMLKKSLKESNIYSNIVFPIVGFRERFIFSSRNLLQLTKSDNIYIAYSNFMSEIFGKLIEPDFIYSHRKYRQIPRVALCPFSRVLLKNIPNDLVLELSNVCVNAGFEVELLLLDDEQFSHPQAPFRRNVPRSFEVYSEALATYDAVVSADSFAAHLAEYYSLPSFIISPVENIYWLPKNAFLNERWGLFSARNHLLVRLKSFLSDVI